MKYNLLSATVLIIFIQLTTIESYAQLKDSNYQNELAKNENNTKFNQNNSAPIAPYAINIKAVRDFAINYKTATNAIWDKNKEGFNVSFNVNEMKCVVFYNTKGNSIGSIKSYQEKKLSKAIRDIVKREYYDYNIYYVREIKTLESNDIPTYVIYMQSETNILTLTVYDGEINILNDFEKQK